MEEIRFLGARSIATTNNLWKTVLRYAHATHCTQKHWDLHTPYRVWR